MVCISNQSITNQSTLLCTAWSICKHFKQIRARKKKFSRMQRTCSGSRKLRLGMCACRCGGLKIWSSSLSNLSGLGISTEETATSSCTPIWFTAGSATCSTYGRWVRCHYLHQALGAAPPTSPLVLPAASIWPLDSLRDATRLKMRWQPRRSRLCIWTRSMAVSQCKWDSQWAKNQDISCPFSRVKWSSLRYDTTTVFWILFRKKRLFHNNFLVLVFTGVS